MTDRAAAEEDFWNVFTRVKRSATPGAVPLEGNKRGKRLGSSSSSTEGAVEQPAFIRSTLGHLLSKLSAETRERVGNSLQQKLHVSTACSGTDQVVVVLKEFAGIFQRTLEQLWACEVVPWKREFIRLNAGPIYIFEDLVDLAKNVEGGAVDAATASRVPAVRPAVLACCCSCTTVSRLNNKDKEGIVHGVENVLTYVSLCTKDTKVELHEGLCCVHSNACTYILASRARRIPEPREGPFVYVGRTYAASVSHAHTHSGTRPCARGTRVAGTHTCYEARRRAPHTVSHTHARTLARTHVHITRNSRADSDTYANSNGM